MIISNRHTICKTLRYVVQYGKYVMAKIIIDKTNLGLIELAFDKTEILYLNRKYSKKDKDINSLKFGESCHNIFS